MVETGRYPVPIQYTVYGTVEEKIAPTVPWVEYEKKMWNGKKSLT